MKSYCILFLLCLGIAAACSSSRLASKSKGIGDTRTRPVHYLNATTVALTDTTNDKTYAFDKQNPVKVGKDGGSGPSNERHYLNALLGPNGEDIWYNRRGSCCVFKTPNGLLDDKGLLDIYEVTWTGTTDTLTIFMNMYDKGDLKIPVGLTARKKE